MLSLEMELQPVVEVVVGTVYREEIEDEDDEETIIEGGGGRGGGGGGGGGGRDGATIDTISEVIKLVQEGLIILELLQASLYLYFSISALTALSSADKD